MEERIVFTLTQAEIESLLIEYYFGECHPEIKKQIEETGTMDCRIKIEKHLIKTITIIDFILKYKKIVEPLNSTISKETIVSLKDLNDIINNKALEKGYEFDCLESHIPYETINKGKPELGYLKYTLKRKEKTKKKGLRKNV